MPHFTDEEVRILNEWARTQPALRRAFPYTHASDNNRGFGTLLNEHDEQIDHGNLLGLGDDDHPQYALKAAGQITFEGTVTAEAFYVASGGEFSFEGLTTPHSVTAQDAYFRDKVTAEAFYVASGGELSNVGLLTHVADITQYVKLREQAVAPATPGIDSLVLWTEDHNGHTTFHMKDVDGVEYEIPQDSAIIVKNDSGGTITKGQPVYISGGTGNVPNVKLARANSATTMPAIGLANETFANGAFGHVMIAGVVKNWNTAAYADGDQLWVSAVTAGVLVTTKPTYPNIQQRVGIVTNGGSVGGGSALVSGDIADFTHVTAVTDGNNNHPDPMRISFNKKHFYVSGDARGDPVVNLKHEHFTKSLTLQNPSNSDTITWWVEPVETEVVKLTAFLRTDDASFYPFCDFTIRHRAGIPSRGSGSELTTNGWRVGFYTGHVGTGVNPLIKDSFTNPTIAPDSFVWLETKKLGEGNGRERELHVTLKLIRT